MFPAKLWNRTAGLCLLKYGDDLTVGKSGCLHVKLPPGAGEKILLLKNAFNWGDYPGAAYPFGKLSDRMNHKTLLAWGLVVLIAADLVLASDDHWISVLVGVALWGVHMGITQGLLATMVAGAAPAELRGTAFGFFNLVSGIAMLIASAVAGLLWDQFGAAFTFYASFAFSLIALIGLIKKT